MTKTWTIIQKIIASLLMVYGVITIYSMASALLRWITYKQQYDDRSWTLDFMVEIIQRANFHFLLGFIPFLAGLTFIMGKRIGWALSLSTGLIGILENLFHLAYEINYPPLGYVSERLLMLKLLLVMFLIISSLLVMPAFRKKYAQHTYAGFYVIGIFSILLIDFYFTYLKGMTYDFL